MKLKLFILASLYLVTSTAYSVTECNEKISNYFIGTSQLNQSDAHLWVTFEGGGSASVSSQSAAFDGMLSSVLMSIGSDKILKMRYLADNAECKTHHSDWVGLWLLK